MILFDDGRQFQIAGTVMSDGTTIIPFAAITVVSLPDSFPITPLGVTPPIIYVELDIMSVGVFNTAMSMAEYNKVALSIQSRAAVAQPTVVQRVAARAAQTFKCCGR